MLGSLRVVHGGKCIFLISVRWRQREIPASVAAGRGLTTSSGRVCGAGVTGSLIAVANISRELRDIRCFSHRKCLAHVFIIVAPTAKFPLRIPCPPLQSSPPSPPCEIPLESIL